MAPKLSLCFYKTHQKSWIKVRLIQPPNTRVYKLSLPGFFEDTASLFSAMTKENNLQNLW